MVERGPLDPEVAAHRGLAGAVFECQPDRLQLFGIDGQWASAPPATFPGSFQAGHDPFPG